MFQRIIDTVLDTAYRYRSPVLTVVVVAALWIAYLVSTKALRRYFRRSAQKPENVQNFLLLWRYAWLGAAVIFVGMALSGSIVSLGISAAFVGMILGWSLQAPVTGLAAWLMIILKKPFRIGDRVIISGITGDVVDITLTHVILNQVGGTIGGEEKSGRGVLIPNATLFQQIIFNYAFESPYLLDEVPVLITYESDFDEATQVLRAAAHQVTREIVEASGQEPFVRAELADSGIRLRLRYQTVATERARIATEITQRIIAEFNRNKKVEFAYPHTEVLHRRKALDRGRDAAANETEATADD